MTMRNRFLRWAEEHSEGFGGFLGGFLFFFVVLVGPVLVVFAPGLFWFVSGVMVGWAAMVFLLWDHIHIKLYEPTEEVVAWVALDVDTFPPALAALDEELRVGFEMVKEIKSRYELELDKMLCKIAPALDDDTKEKLKVDAKGKFPVGTVRKFSYMRGVEVATANPTATSANPVKI